MVQGGEANDFRDIMLPTDSQCSQSMSQDEKAKPRKGEKRKYMLAYETVPAQMLNVYGRATFPDMSDEDVWKHMNEPLKTGAEYMTEYCSMDSERRGVAFNRFCLSMVLFFFSCFYSSSFFFCRFLHSLISFFVFSVFFFAFSFFIFVNRKHIGIQIEISKLVRRQQK